MVQEHSVSLDPLWDGVAGSHHPTDPVPSRESQETLFVLSPWHYGGHQAPKLETGVKGEGRASFLTARLLSRGVPRSPAASRTSCSGCRLWKEQLILLQDGHHLPPLQQPWCLTTRLKTLFFSLLDSRYCCLITFPPMGYTKKYSV